MSFENAYVFRSSRTQKLCDMAIRVAARRGRKEAHSNQIRIHKINIALLTEHAILAVGELKPSVVQRAQATIRNLKAQI